MPDRTLMPPEAEHYHLSGGPVTGPPLCVVVTESDLHDLIMVDGYEACTAALVRDLDCPGLRRKVAWKYENMLRARGLLVICPRCLRRTPYVYKRWIQDRSVRGCAACLESLGASPS